MHKLFQYRFKTVIAAVCLLFVAKWSIKVLNVQFMNKEFESWWWTDASIRWSANDSAPVSTWYFFAVHWKFVDRGRGRT